MPKPIKQTQTKKRKDGQRTPRIVLNTYSITDARNISEILCDAPPLDLTVTSPPYWDAKNYGSENQIGFKQSLDDYIIDLANVFSQIWHHTKADGSLWIIIKSIKKNGTLHLLPFILAQRLSEQPTCKWNLQDILIWHKPHSLPWSHRQKLSDSHEYILCFSKSNNFSLNIDAIRSAEGIGRWWIKYPERYHPQGKSLTNVWEISIPTQGSWGSGHFEHACPLPLELVERIILLACPKNGVVLDPFAGTGTTAIAANNLGRKWISTDINDEYRKMFVERMEHEANSKNKTSTYPHILLSQTNLTLRQLKYATLLYKKMAPSLKLTTTELPFILVKGGTIQKAANPYWVKDVQITLVFNNEIDSARLKYVQGAADMYCKKPPLSKFQIEVKLNTIKMRDVAKHASTNKFQNFYVAGHFWNSILEMSLDKIADHKPLRGLPTLISNLKANETQAY